MSRNRVRRKAGTPEKNRISRKRIRRGIGTPAKNRRAPSEYPQRMRESRDRSEMKKSFRELLTGRAYLCGAMGSRLMALGYSPERCAVLNVEKPEVPRSVHESYLKAGSDVIFSNTFGCNALKADTSEHSLERQIRAGCDIACEAAREYGAFAAYDCGPSGDLLKPYGRLDFEEAYELFADQARIVAKTGVDGIALETFSDLNELRAAILAFRDNSDLPLMCGMTFEKNGRTYAGADAASFALVAQALGADAVGANCGTGPEDMALAVSKIVRATTLPVFCKPNAGLPRYENGKAVYGCGVSEFCAGAERLVRLGANIIGGCCGTDERYVAELIRRTERVPVERPPANVDALCSFSAVADWSKPLIVGECVNPAGRPALMAALRDRDFDRVLALLVEQKAAGADMADICVGMPGIDEAETLVGVVEACQGASGLPFSIDSSDPSALERAVRRHAGICAINSATGDDAQNARIFPIAKKYGSYVICLCMDSRGIPADSDGRIEVAARLIRRAAEFGIPKSRLVFDPLALALGADSSNGRTTLETLGRLVSELRVKTTLGLSNISYGLPNRKKLNGAMLGLALDLGASSVIADPSLKRNSDPASLALLNGRDPGCARYVSENSGAPEPDVSPDETLDLKRCVARGLRSEAAKAAASRMKSGATESELIAEISEGMAALGEAYESGKAFLPGLISGGEAAKAALDAVRAHCAGSAPPKPRAVVLLATVRGDVHDIGKNIVKSVVSSRGFRAIDLGRDVPASAILSAIREHSPDAVGLSALMTTTLPSMIETTRAIRASFPSLPVLVGGAAVTESLAKSIGALYAKDAQAATRVLGSLAESLPKK